MDGNIRCRRERERRLGEDFGDALRDDVRLVGARFSSFGADGLGLVVFADDLPRLSDGDLPFDVAARGFNEIRRWRKTIDLL